MTPTYGTKEYYAQRSRRCRVLLHIARRGLQGQPLEELGVDTLYDFCKIYAQTYEEYEDACEQLRRIALATGEDIQK